MRSFDVFNSGQFYVSYRCCAMRSAHMPEKCDTDTVFSLVLLTSPPLLYSPSSQTPLLATTGGGGGVCLPAYSGEGGAADHHEQGGRGCGCGGCCTLRGWNGLLSVSDLCSVLCALAACMLCLSAFMSACLAKYFLVFALLRFSLIYYIVLYISLM